MSENPIKSNCSSEDDEDVFSDEDTCNPQEINKIFPLKFKIVDECPVKDYILNVCSDKSFSRLACGLSNNTAHIFDVSNQNGLSPERTIQLQVETNDTICGVKFLDESANNLLIGSTNGEVRLYDLRTHEKEQACFNASKTITCFDRNANSRIICMGTELELMNVLLMFFDVRGKTELGAYRESHNDDISSIRFHPTNPDILSTGCTGGLINLFDILKTNEEDALMMTINTGNSVYKLNWHRNVYEKDLISCLTHSNDFKMYKCEEGDVVVDFERNQITDVIRRKSISNLNLFDCHNMQDENILLLAGSNLNQGNILRSAFLRNRELIPHANFEGNKQIIRGSIFNAKTNVLVTAGEGGLVSLWSPQTVDGTDTQKSCLPSDANLLKSKSKLNKVHARTPY